MNRELERLHHALAVLDRRLAADELLRRLLHPAARYAPRLSTAEQTQIRAHINALVHDASFAMGFWLDRIPEASLDDLRPGIWEGLR